MGYNEGICFTCGGVVGRVDERAAFDVSGVGDFGTGEGRGG